MGLSQIPVIMRRMAMCKLQLASSLVIRFGRDGTRIESKDGSEISDLSFALHCSARIGPQCTEGCTGVTGVGR